MALENQNISEAARRCLAQFHRKYEKHLPQTKKGKLAVVRRINDYRDYFAMVADAVSRAKAGGGWSAWRAKVGCV